MVQEQIARRGLTDERLLSAFEQVPRHLFVGEGSETMAYEDMPLPIGFEQTISQPYIVALMISLLQLDGDERLLEVGTGSGYQAALLSHLAAEVHTVEIVPELARQAAAKLAELGYTNVQVHSGDGSAGWLPNAPYGGVIVAAASPRVPAPLLEQLVDGGRLVLPVENHRRQLLKVYVREGMQYAEQVITSVAFVPLRGKYGWG